MNEKGRKIAIWSIVVLWMIIIFGLSSESGEQSDNRSFGIVRIVSVIIGKVSPSSDAWTSNHFIRKSAHCFAYLVLGMVVLIALRKMGVSGTKSILLTLVVCIVYAISDEIHQGFVPSRAPMLTDIIIDSCGSLLGTALYSRLPPS